MELRASIASEKAAKDLAAKDLNEWDANSRSVAPTNIVGYYAF